MGVIHLDAGVVIALLDADDVHHDTATTSLTSYRVRGNRFAMSAVVFAEILVQPYRMSPATVQQITGLCVQLPIEIVNLDQAIADRAAEIRAQHSSLTLPDAIVIASAITCGAQELVTTDRKWPNADQLNYEGVVHQL
jgi:predicted nucleic acid-binding protein